jgi:hypothetical protein
MIITIQPSDLIKRCLWLEYKRFCLLNVTEEEIDKIIVEDKPFVMIEEDAYVIGLLKVIETDNLVHRFNIYIEDLLNVRSNLFDNKLYINKNVILSEVREFKNRFPESFKPSFEYKTAIDDMNVHIDDIYERLEELKTFKKILNDKTYIFVSSSDVKNLI